MCAYTIGMGKSKQKQAAVAGLQSAADRLEAEAAQQQDAWTRVTTGGANVQADNREVDVALVEALLTQRWGCKQKKDYKNADTAAAALKDLGVIYVDERREWYTRGGFKPTADGAAKAMSAIRAAGGQVVAKGDGEEAAQAEHGKVEKGKQKQKKQKQAKDADGAGAQSDPGPKGAGANCKQGEPTGADVAGEATGKAKRRRSGGKRKRDGDATLDPKEEQRRERQRALQQEALRKMANGTYVKKKRNRSSKDRRSRPPAVIPNARSYPSME